MSTILIPMEKFNKLASSLVYNKKYHPTNIFDSDIYSVFDLDLFKNDINDLKLEVKKFVSDLALLNNYTYDIQYQTKNSNAAIVELNPSDIFDNCCQIGKCLDCIQYNCDFEKFHIDDEKFKNLIKIVKDNIIKQLPEYVEAEWV